MHTRCDQNALSCKHWIKGSVTLFYEASAENFSQSTGAISCKKETATYFGGPRRGPFLLFMKDTPRDLLMKDSPSCSWKTLSPAHERHSHLHNISLLLSGSAKGGSGIPVYPKKIRQNTQKYPRFIQIYPKLYPGILYTWNSKKVIYRIPVFKLQYTVYPI